MLQKAAEGFSYLFIAKIFTKVVDFLLNNLVIRKIDPRIFGLTLYFNLLQNTILLWVKMCFKNSYLKRNIKSSPNDKVSQEETDQILVNSAKNLMTIGTYVTVFWGLALYALWIYLYGDLDVEFSKATALVCVGAIMESVQDILVVKALLNFDYGLVAKAESLAISTKTIVLFVTIQFNIFPTLICFGLSNVAYGLSITIATYILNKNNSIGSIKDALVLTKLDSTNSKGGSYVHSDMLNMTKEMTLISFPKFLLQEIEKIILANINTDPKVNGEYMVVSNLGSMIPRYFYAPTEEVCYNLFAKLDREGSKTEEKTLKMSKNEIDILQNIFKIINILGSLIAVFGFIYASTILDFLYGGKWSTESCVTGFQLYSLYIYVMGINGVSESFFFSTVGEKYLQKYRYFIIFNTLVFVGASYFLGKFGLWGIVLANIISMLIRIMNCLYYIRINMDSFSSFASFLRSTLPNKFYLIFLGIVLIIGKVSQSLHSKILFRLLEAGALGVCTLGLIYKFHRGDIKAIMDKRKKKAE